MGRIYKQITITMKLQLFLIALLALLPVVVRTDVVTLESDEISVASSWELGMTMPCYISNCITCFVATECRVCGDKGNCCSKHCTHCSNDICNQCKEGYHLNMGLCAADNSCTDPFTACAHCDA
jgi:hypothetical protein